MSVLINLRSASSYPQPYPYIDTPDFAYAGAQEDGSAYGWLNQLWAQNDTPIGTVAGSPTVAIIGGGVSGLCAGYELSRAGCNVTVFEQSSEVGGRCASFQFSDGNIAEMGSMRFPPSEFILDFYFRKFGIVPNGIFVGLPEFPDPGKKPTYVCYGSDVQTWNGSQPPTGFETVSAGWSALVSGGLTSNNTGNSLQSVPNIVGALQQGQADLATQYWQAYVDAFGQTTFYGGLYQIFTGSGGYDIPGGTAWTAEDFDKFGALGVGSGGFGPLYPIGFTEIFRIIINGLETSQRFLQPSSSLNDGIRTLPLALASQMINAGGQVLTNTAISAITTSPTGFVLSTPAGPTGPFDKVIVATTTRAMELTLNLTAPQATIPLISRDTAVGIMRTHIVSSNKVAAVIPNFWSNAPAAIRCLQTDTLAHQVYTLDYDEAGTGICFISYVWDDDAVKQQAITNGLPTGAADNELLYNFLIGTLDTVGGGVGQWAQQLVPLNGDYENNVIFEEWQSSPYFAGAFKLSQPGQDSFVQTMFFDYQKAGTPSDTGVYIAGDCIHWNSGWVEGGLTTALNAAAGVIASLGGTVTPNSAQMTPLGINAGRYNYF